MNALEIKYVAPPTLKLFHRSSAFYRGVLGPVGSGKSTGCCFELFRRASEQSVSMRDGLRKTRFAIVRNTYRELADTTLKTWLDWFPEQHFGKFSRTDMQHNMSIGDIRCEVLFRALDRPDHVKKLLSLELTGGWVNEAREVPKSIIDTLGDRVGRYPSKRDGGCVWAGVIMDTNPPDDDHWWFKLAEESANKLTTWQFFRQPGGLIEKAGQFVPNPLAENLEGLPDNYYMDRVEGKKPDHVRVYYCAQYGFVKDGRPVIPEYVDAIHCTKEPIDPVKSVPIRVGIDWGLTPAAILGQKLANGRWVWIDEIVTEHMGAKNFGKLFAQTVKEKYPGFAFESPHGDPAGNAEAQTDEHTPFQIFNAAVAAEGVKITAVPAPTNDPALRHGTLGMILQRDIDGVPGLLISPTLKITRKGLAGGYCYKRMQVAGDDKFHDKPDKNKFSHPVEAGEYMLVGAGEWQELVRRNRGETGTTKKALNDYAAHDEDDDEDGWKTA
jgi:hypothetical protein